MKFTITLLITLLAIVLNTLSAQNLTYPNSYNFDIHKTEELRVRDGLPNFFQKLKESIQIEVSTDGGAAKIYNLESKSGKKIARYVFLDEISIGSHITTVKLVKLEPDNVFQVGQFLLVDN